MREERFPYVTPHGAGRIFMALEGLQARRGAIPCRFFSFRASRLGARPRPREGPTSGANTGMMNIFPLGDI
jgi:hypothetical protein